MQIIGVQTDMIWEQKVANQEKIRALLEDQQIQPDALVVLPEMFDTGFSMNLAATCQSEERESEMFLRELAKSNRCAVLGGVVGPLVDGKGSNEAVAFDAQGHELVRYRKTQPFTLTGEHERYGSGDGHRLFVWKGVSIAPFICYDLRFPEIFRPAAVDGADLILVIACWPATRSEHWVRLLQARAIENQAFVVGVNRCGTDPTLSYDGRSAAFDPLGRSIVEADGREQVLNIMIDPEQARTWRNKFPALRDIRAVYRTVAK